MYVCVHVQSEWMRLFVTTTRLGGVCVWEEVLPRLTPCPLLRVNIYSSCLVRLFLANSPFLVWPGRGALPLC